MTALGYEFELEMLIAAKHLAIPVVEQPITTIFTPNRAVHPLVERAQFQRMFADAPRGSSTA